MSFLLSTKPGYGRPPNVGVFCHYMDKQDLSRAGDLMFHRYIPNDPVAGRPDIGTQYFRAAGVFAADAKGKGMV